MTREVIQMSDTTMAAPAQEIAFSKRALKALGEGPEIRCGALSLLARIEQPDAPSDPDGLVESLNALTGQWTWAAPALLDPHLTVALLFGDGDTSLIGQYVWPDAESRGPGYKATVGKDDVRLAGPVTNSDVLLNCLDLVSISGVAESGPLKMSFSLDEFWATLALLDAYRMALQRRRLARQGGLPVGVSAAAFAEAWKAGVTVADPGWSVSLFALLRPDLVPQGFETRVSAVIDKMDGAGVLAKLAGDPGDPLGDVYIFGQGLEMLCNAVLEGIVQFGLSVERLRPRNAVEMMTVGGWRTSSGFWVADLGSVPPGGTGSVVVTLLGPTAFTDLVELALGGNAPAGDAPFEMKTPYSRDAVLAAVRKAKPVATHPAAVAVPAPVAPTAPAWAPAPAPVAPAPVAPMAPAWAPTHTVPPEGMTAWPTPDPQTSGVQLGGGLPVAVAERTGDWAHVVTSNGWSGWVDGRRLV